MANILLSIKFVCSVAPMSLYFSHKSWYISHPVAVILPFLQHNRSPGKNLFLHPHTCLCAQTPQQSVAPHTQVFLLSRREVLHKLHLSQETLHHIFKMYHFATYKTKTTVGTETNYITNSSMFWGSLFSAELCSFSLSALEKKKLTWCFGVMRNSRRLSSRAKWNSW